MTTVKPAPCLVIIDVQKAFNDAKWGERNQPEAETKMAGLLLFWRNQSWPIVHVRHESIHPDSLFFNKRETFAFKTEVLPKPAEKVITKRVNSAFIGTELHGFLKRSGITDLVICGLTLPHCVSTTVRMSANYGFHTYLVSDATASFALKKSNRTYYSADTIHQTELAILKDEFAAIINAEEARQIK